MSKLRLARWIVGASMIGVLAALVVASGEEAALAGGGSSSAPTYQAYSHPVLLLVSIGLVVLYVWILRLPLPIERSSAPAGLWRRFCAFLADYFFAAFMIVPVVGFIGLAIEAARSGHFAWAIRRAMLPGDNWLSVALALVNIAVLLSYFALPLFWDGATPGSLLLGISVIQDSGKPPSIAGALARPVFGFLALCLWPLSIPLALSNPDKRMWQDIRCRTHVVRLTD